ncbi:glycosyltransferase [Alteromonas sp. 5E99-2]|uniref:glycosyltransferase n=1 Tax=Alteromonas sp. 5E99-2 TaxID=2817683 RepID=UPI001A97E16B|nr:glycosyltransferase family 4 protein [Alteromonas sp. 5E99-2]MBO1254930.1 glycosyltransferase [Alteromonas sp. 5E99-2]
MKCLVIGSVWPEPNSSAAGENMLTILRGACQRNWNVEFACAAQESTHAFNLDLLGIKQVNIELNNSSFDSFVSESNPDIVIFDRFMTEEQFGWRVSNCLPNAVKILNTEDLHGLRQQTHLETKTTKLDSTINDVMIREVASIMRCDKTLVITKNELNWLTEYANIKSDLLHYYPLLPHCDGSSSPSFEQRQHVSFIGNFKHAPNWNAVLTLSRFWPKIRAKLPNVECHIYGAYPPKKATALTNKKSGFIVKGWIENADDAFKGYRLSLAPIQFGAGVKGKLIRAITNGTPSVVTPLAIKGICIEEQWPGKVTHNDESFIDSVISLYNDKLQWEKHHLNTFQLKAKLAKEKKQHSNFYIETETLHRNLKSFREKHILSRAFNHQTMRSHQYMSQWIEAKNNSIDKAQS